MAAAVEHGMMKVNAPTKEEMFQYSPHELVGHHAASHAYDAGYRAALRAAGWVVEDAIDPYCREEHKDGTEFFCEDYGCSSLRRIAKRIAALGVPSGQ